MQENLPPGSLRRQTSLYRRIVRVMDVGFSIAIGLMLAGLIAGIITGDHVARETDRLSNVLPGAARFRAQDIVELGILTLLATPAFYVLVSLVIFIRERDGLFVMVCAALLGILLLSVGVALQ